MKFCPDVVIVGFCVNDVGIHAPNLTTIRILERYGPLVRSLRFLQLLTVQIDRSALLRKDRELLNREEVFRHHNAQRIARIDDDPTLQDMMARLRPYVRGIDPKTPVSVVSWFASESKVGSLRFAFERLGRIVSAHDVSVVVVLIPYLEEGTYQSAFRIAYDIVHHEASRAGFHFLDLSAELNAPGIQEIAQYRRGARNPLHPNERGHQIIAQRLFEELPKLVPAILAP